MDPRDAVILSLAERLYICSRLLTAAAEKLGWDNARVQELIQRLKETVDEDTRHACIE